MQQYIDTCVPWPIHPQVNPIAITYCPGLNVTNMTHGTDVCSDEFYDNIVYLGGMYNVTRRARMGGYVWYWTNLQGFSPACVSATAMESVILEEKRKQLLV